MVTADQYFEMAENFKAQGNLQTAIQMYNEALRLRPDFALVHVSVAKLMAQQNNPQGEYEALKQFMNCGLTGVTIDLLPAAKQRIADIEKQAQGIPAPK